MVAVISLPDPFAETLQYPRDYIIATITAVAMANGLDPRIALATSYEESGFDPFKNGDYKIPGDESTATSFGLFMLHEGGELGSHSQFWAYSPANNCAVAIPEIARQRRANPGKSAGQVAALAQKPKNPVEYAAAVDAYYRTLTTKGVSGLPSKSIFGPHNVPFTHSKDGKPLDPGQAIPQGITGGAFTGTSDWLLSHLGLPNLGVLLRLFGAVLLVGAGLFMLFRNSVSLPKVVPV